MTGSRLLVELVVVLGTAAVTTVVFQALRLPVVLGYVLAGLVIGPYLPVPLVADAGLVHVLSELGVILLMFTIGLEQPLSTFARVGLPGALIAVFEVTLVIAVGTAIGMALGWTPLEAVFGGACLGISSTMLVAKVFEELGLKGGFTEQVFAVLVFEDIIAIVLLAILAAVGTGSELGVPQIVGTVLRLAGFLAVMLIVGLLIVPRVIRPIARRARAETLLIASLVVCFGASALADRAGYSVALGAFVAGVMVAESGRGHTVVELVRPFRDVFAMMFFVSIGMTIDPGQLASEAVTILIFTVVVLVMKPIGVSVGVFLAGNGVLPAVRSGLSLAQIGELSFVIAGIGATSGVTRSSLLTIAVGVSCVTTLTSSLMIRRSEDTANWVAGRLPTRLALFVSFYDAWLGRLRGRDKTRWRKLRRSIVVLVLDTTAIGAIVIAAATVAPELARSFGLDGMVARAAVISVALVVALPFGISLVRRVMVIGRVIALEVIPAVQGHDLGRAPRRALRVTIELGIVLAIAVPFVAVTQPFVPGGTVVGLIIVIAVVVAALRSLRDFDGHVRAGSEVILELMAHQPDRVEPLSAIDTILPGFGGLVSIQLADGSPAIGQSLAQLDLRARTGATVLAIGRGEHGLASPSPHEPLRAGDTLALTGSDPAIAAARVALDVASASASASTR
jgi:monovalent cation:H+ antiporter-2, CPA2 family